MLGADANSLSRLEAALLVLLLSACSPPPSGPSLRESCETAGRFHSIDALVRALGPETSRASKTLPNAYTAGQLDEYFQLGLRDGGAEFVVVGDSQHRFLLQRLWVSVPGSALPGQQWLGKPLAELRHAWGRPASAEKESLTFSCGESDQLEVDASDGLVRTLRWSLYVD